MTFEQTTLLIQEYMETQKNSPYKNMNASYLIVSILKDCDFTHYGPETILQDALNEYQNLLVKSE